MSGNIRTSCTDCGAQYGGNAGHCKACHRTFSSDSAFDKHLVSRVTAGCHDPATLRDKHERQVLTYDPERGLWKFVDHTGGARLAGLRGLPGAPEGELA